jgi:hydroxyquinol 1,2-dioxygenase
VAGDQYLDSDVVFGVKDSLISEFKDMPTGMAADGRRMDQPHCHLRHDFRLKTRAVMQSAQAALCAPS